MKLTTRGRNAVTALLEIAIYGGDTPIPLLTIAKRQNLSLSYLETLFRQMRASNLVKSHRGPGGGYVLVQPAECISIAQVVEAVDKPKHGESVNSLILSGELGFNDFLETYLWEELYEKMYEHLGHINLRDLLNKKKLVDKVQQRTLHHSSPLLHTMHLCA